MANTLTIHQRAARSAVALKALMAVTGFFLIAFLLMHMFGNTKLLIPNVGKTEFNDYSEALRHLLYPILPAYFFLWCFRIFMLACILLHIYSAVALWRRARSQTGVGRYQKAKFLDGPYVPFFMRWGGIIIAIFVVMHLLQFTAQLFTPGYSNALAPADRMIAAFSNPWYFIAYLIAMAAVCFHVAHGFWSAFATLGGNVSKGSERVLRICAGVCALLLLIGFMAAPTVILFGGIR